jgi:precorrin-6B methylase 1
MTFEAGEYKGKTCIFEYRDLGGDDQASLVAIVTPGPECIKRARLLAGSKMLLEAAQDALQRLRLLDPTGDHDLLEEAIDRSEGI